MNECASQVAQVVKNLPANVGDVKDTGSIPGLGRSSGGEYGNPLPYSFLENPMDRGSTGSQRVRHNWSNLAHMHIYTHTYKYTKSIDILHKKDTVYV